MSAIISRAARRAGPSVFRTSRRAASTTANEGRDTVLQKGARRDPELYILLTIMTGAFGLAGWHFGSKPTSTSSETAVTMAKDTMPWQTDSQGDGVDEHFKYQYHPGGDRSKAPKNAPSALNTVIVPSVTLPKKAHDLFNKYGKEDW